METQKLHRENAKTISKSNSFFKPTIQKKMSVGSANDVYEIQADAMANKVMRMTDSSNQNFTQTGALIQKKCSHCEQEEKVQMKPLSEETTPLIQRHSSENASYAPSHVESQINNSKGGGSIMDSETKNFMETRFGTDFSEVKIHTGSQAVQMSRELNAQAFTVGNDVYFNEGKYSPHSDNGKHLLAHELTHTVQQGGGIGRKIQKLGANPGCNKVQSNAIHQAIYNARGWTNTTLRTIASDRNSAKISSALRRNFGNTYGVISNLDLIVGRIRSVNHSLGTMPYTCDDGTDALCVNGNCGFAIPGSGAMTVCPHTITEGGIYLTGCVLHESFHATFSRFTIDEYSGWHGNSGSTPTYPGVGVEPLLNADSYTTFIMDLS